MKKNLDVQRLSYFTIKQSNEPVFWIAADGEIVHVNEAARRYTGYPYDRIVGVKIYDLHPEENVHTWKARWQELKEKKRVIFEKWQPHHDGKWLRIKVTQNLIDVDGTEYTVSLVEDKTREYEMQQKIRDSERRLTTLMSNLPGMAYRCLDDENWTMQFISQGCEKLTGCQAKDLIHNQAMTYNQLIYEDDREYVKETVRKQVDRNEHFELQYRIQLPSGELRWVWERGTTVPCDESDCQFIEGFITDITQIKNAEQALVEKEKALRKLKDRLEEETVYLRQEIKATSNFEEIISRSDVFHQVLRNVEKVADTDSTVLILGETGTGKELIARALHNNSRRSNRVLVAVNCAALPPEMIESELFGHEKGAFTGAYEKKTGRFELAHEGTIFLDEIGDLPLNLQTKLLRVLQEGEYQRVGSSKNIKTDVRVIAATNRDLQAAIRNGDFRADLYYRLNVFPILVPPLRERKQDIPLLVRHFVKKYAAKTGRSVGETSQKVMDQLMRYDWPGNIRELENVIERAVILSEDGRIKPGSWIPSMQTQAEHTISSLEESERQHILKALDMTNWRISGENGAAALLNIKRTTLQARMKKLDIQRSS